MYVHVHAQHAVCTIMIEGATQHASTIIGSSSIAVYSTHSLKLMQYHKNGSLAKYCRQVCHFLFLHCSAYCEQA